MKKYQNAKNQFPCAITEGNKKTPKHEEKHCYLSMNQIENLNVGKDQRKSSNVPCWNIFRKDISDTFSHFLIP